MSTLKSIISNARYAIRNSDGGEGGAIIESIISNAGYAVGDGDRGKGGATIESLISNARYAVGDNCIFTTSNKGVCRSFNNSIAVVTTIISGITIFHFHRGEGGAIIESTMSNARYAITDSDGGEGGASRESIISNACYAVGSAVVGDG